MARSFSHWTPHYLVDRSLEKLYRRTHPGLPWFAPGAVEFLDHYLLPTDEGLEFGSGRSTLWFAARVKHLTTVEHNPEWADRVRSLLKDNSVSNVDLVQQPRLAGDSHDIDSSGYVQVTRRFQPESLDFVIIDGIYRAQCARQSLPLLSPHAMLILDNVNKALPSASRAPNSRTPEAGPDGEIWSEVWTTIQHWRYFWTGNGVSDTAIFFKP
jgi:predicted O-methyltransferase YrrM